ncbi:MAG: ABC transporter permease [Planctomycetes bacterium]|nr:ABC transporter permease [Planctomycetota bacterium]MCB9870435.1 ABC transporter permease [Planctomycetota bacterium]
MTARDHSYDAATATRGMLRHAVPLFGYPGVIASHTTILANFFRRDLLGRFRGSFLGVFWVLVQPIFLFAIYFFVFGFLFAHRAMTGADKVEFALYLFSGILAYTSFNEATTRSCNVVLENGNLVKKVAFPCELLPIPSILVSMIVYAVGAAVLLSVGLSMGQLRLGWSTAALPLVLLVHFVMTLGFGLLLATLQVLVRDTIHLYTIFSQAWFFLSPVFWAHSLLEGKLLENGLERWAFVLELNPLYPLIQAHRLALGFGPDHNQMRHVVMAKNAAGEVSFSTGAPLPDVWYYLGYAAIWATVMLVIGYSFFMSRKRKFSDLV